jgi:hypothetical protein
LVDVILILSFEDDELESTAVKMLVTAGSIPKTRASLFLISSAKTLGVRIFCTLSEFGEVSLDFS